jgi:hypothetical protein
MPLLVFVKRLVIFPYLGAMISECSPLFFIISFCMCVFCIVLYLSI